MSGPANVRRWLREHPLASDVLLAAMVLLAALTVRADRPSALDEPAGWATALTVLACGLLVFRRRFPAPVWLGTLTLGVLGITAQGGPASTVFPAFVALYSLAVRRTRTEALLAAVPTAVALIAALGIATIESLQTPTTYVVTAWSGLAAVLGIAVKNQRAVVVAAEERARLAEETAEGEARRRVAEERQRIARELHDVVAHHISVINVQSGVALHLLDSAPGQVREALGHIRTSSEDALREMAALLGLLRTTEEGAATTPAPGLIELDDLVESVRRTGLDVTVREEGQRRPLPPLADVTVYRVVQEALTNAHRHGTGSATLTLLNEGDQTTVTVANPVDPARSGGPTSGLGLIGMKERVEACGGAVEAAADGRGHFVVHAIVPVASPTAAWTHS